MDKLGPEKKRYVPPEVFHPMMRQREDEIIKTLSGNAKEVVLDIMEGRPNPHDDDYLAKRLFNVEVIKKMNPEEREQVLNALEQLADISRRKVRYVVAKKPLALRVVERLTGKPKQERDYNWDNAMNFRVVFFQIHKILEDFGRTAKKDEK